MATYRRRSRSAAETGQSVFGSTGWLFADLMLALAVAFLVASTVGSPPPPRPDPTPTRTTQTPTPTPTATRTPTPTPTRPPEPALELQPITVRLRVNAAALQRGDPRAVAALQQQLRRNPRLAGRHAGLVLTFGGAGDGNEARALAVARRANAAMTGLGRQGYVFRGTVYRTLFARDESPNTVRADVYVFKRVRR